MVRGVFGCLTALVCLLVSCGGGSSTLGPGGSGGGGYSCGTVMPCGGDIVGTWTAATGCVTGVPSTESEGTCTVGISASIGLTGTVTFDSNGMVTANAGLNVTETLSVPAGCLTQTGIGTLTCTQLGQGIESDQGDAGATANCSSAAGGGCTCDVTQSNPAMSESATYTTSNSTLTTTDPSGDMSTDSYCVVGSVLHIISTSMGSGVDGGTASETVDLVFTK